MMAWSGAIWNGKRAVLGAGDEPSFLKFGVNFMLELLMSCRFFEVPRRGEPAPPLPPVLLTIASVPSLP